MTAMSDPLSSEARVATAAARRYLGQLCKHFQHKLPVSLDEQRGRIEFSAGVCELDATEPELLALRVNAADEASVANVEDVVTRHLQRFAFREELNVRWTRPT